MILFNICVNKYVNSFVHKWTWKFFVVLLITYRYCICLNEINFDESYCLINIKLSTIKASEVLARITVNVSCISVLLILYSDGYKFFDELNTFKRIVY